MIKLFSVLWALSSVSAHAYCPNIAGGYIYTNSQNKETKIQIFQSDCTQLTVIRNASNNTYFLDGIYRSYRESDSLTKYYVDNNMIMMEQVFEGDKNLAPRVKATLSLDVNLNLVSQITGYDTSGKVLYNLPNLFTRSSNQR